MAAKKSPAMESFNELFKCAANIKTAQLAEKRREFDKQPKFIQSGLYFYDKYAKTRDGSTASKVSICDTLRKEGKELFEAGKFEMALQNYEEALSLFRYIMPKSAKWRQEAIEDEKLVYIEETGNDEEERRNIAGTKVLCYLNIAACNLKLNNSDTAIAAANEALKLDPQNVKALYRRAKARLMKAKYEDEEYKQAIADLETGTRIDPENVELRAELENIKASLQRSRREEKALFKKLIQSAPQPPVKGEELKNPSAQPDEVEDMVGRLNAKIAENLAVIQVLEKTGSKRRVSIYQGNVHNLEAMKRRLLELKNIDMSKPFQEARAKGKELGRRIQVTDEELKQEVQRMHTEKLREAVETTRKWLESARGKKLKGLPKKELSPIREEAEAVSKSSGAKVEELKEEEEESLTKLARRIKELEAQKQAGYEQLSKSQTKEYIWILLGIVVLILGYFIASELYSHYGQQIV